MAGKGKHEKGKAKAKGEEKGYKDKSDKGDRKGGKGDRDDKGKGKAKVDESKYGGNFDEQEADDFAARTTLSSAAPDFTPSMGNYSMYGDPMQQWGDWPLAPAAPPLWREYKDEDDVAYYHNAKTGLCQWEKPPELETPKPAGVERGEGFRERRDGPPRDAADREERRKDREHDGGARPKGGDSGKGRRRGKDDRKDGGEFGPPGCNLFVFHLPDDWADDDLHEHFAPHGNVISAKVMKELGTGRSRGFGFVSYEDRVSSATAIKKMQGYKVLGKRLKVEFKKGEQEGGREDDGDRVGDHDADDDGGGKKSYPDDERLIGYLRAITAKNVVQTPKEDDDARPAEMDADGAAEPHVGDYDDEDIRED